MKRPLLLAVLLAAFVLAAVTIVEEGTSGQVPPTVQGIRILNVYENKVEIDWETDVPCKCKVEWGRTKDDGNTKVLEGPFETYFQTNITGLDRTTKYHFRIIAENLAGEIGYSSDRTVTTGPQDEVEGGTPGWVWGLTATLIIILLVYLFLLRPAQQ
jgi:hypothetical protein